MISKQKDKRNYTVKKTTGHKTKYPHITINKRVLNGEPVVSGTRVSVKTIAGYYQMGMSVDEILNSLSHISASQVHSALAYYFDHQKRIDREIRTDQKFFDSLKKLQN